jgi:hypothetical protein
MAKPKTVICSLDEVPAFRCEADEQIFWSTHELAEELLKEREVGETADARAETDPPTDEERAQGQEASATARRD